VGCSELAALLAGKQLLSAPSSKQNGGIVIRCTMTAVIFHRQIPVNNIVLTFTTSLDPFVAKITHAEIFPIK